MQGIVHHGQRDMRFERVPDPKIQDPLSQGACGCEIFDAHEEGVLEVVLTP